MYVSCVFAPCFIFLGRLGDDSTLKRVSHRQCPDAIPARAGISCAKRRWTSSVVPVAIISHDGTSQRSLHCTITMARAVFTVLAVVAAILAGIFQLSVKPKLVILGQGRVIVPVGNSKCKTYSELQACESMRSTLDASPRRS